MNTIEELIEKAYIYEADETGRYVQKLNPELLVRITADIFLRGDNSELIKKLFVTN